MLPAHLRRLVRDQAEADPHDAERQLSLLDELRTMRELMEQGAQSDLAAYLDTAAHLTELLAGTEEPTRETVAAIVGRLVSRVAEAFDTDGVPGPRVDRTLDVGAGADGAGLRMLHDQPLGEILVQHGRVTQDQVDDALRAQRATGMRLGELLVMLGAASWDDVHHAVGTQHRMRGAARPAR